MRLVKGTNHRILLKYGFQKLDDNYKKYQGIEDDDALFYHKGYIYEMGAGRRGQYYYLICDVEGYFSVFASKPDGDGASCLVDDIFIKMIHHGIVAKTNYNAKNY